MAPETSGLPRRNAIRILAILLSALGVSGLFGPIIAFFWPAKLEEFPSEPVPIGPPDQVPPGGSVTVRFGRYPALIINTSDGMRAYSAVCTHFACLVKWNPDSGRIECPCHEGFFNVADGSVISGPPPEGLMPLQVFVQDSTLYIGGEA